jgi:hypothetical protein
MSPMVILVYCWLRARDWMILEVIREQEPMIRRLICRISIIQSNQLNIKEKADTNLFEILRKLQNRIHGLFFDK